MSVIIHVEDIKTFEGFELFYRCWNYAGVEFWILDVVAVFAFISFLLPAFYLFFRRFPAVRPWLGRAVKRFEPRDRPPDTGLIHIEREDYYDRPLFTWLGCIVRRWAVSVTRDDYGFKEWIAAGKEDDEEEGEPQTPLA